MSSKWKHITFIWLRTKWIETVISSAFHVQWSQTYIAAWETTTTDRKIPKHQPYTTRSWKNCNRIAAHRPKRKKKVWYNSSSIGDGIRINGNARNKKLRDNHGILTNWCTFNCNNLGQWNKWSKSMGKITTNLFFGNNNTQHSARYQKIRSEIRNRFAFVSFNAQSLYLRLDLLMTCRFRNQILKRCNGNLGHTVTRNRFLIRNVWIIKKFYAQNI